MNTFTVTTPSAPVQWRTIAVSGSDASAYLQGQLTADIHQVDAAGCATLLLEPSSEVIAQGWLQTSDQGYALTVRGESSDAVMTRLRRFRLRADVDLLEGEGAYVPYATVGEQVSDGIAGPHEFERFVTPHVFGATFVAQHVSFTKGCFTGQELVGRLDARGANVPYRFVRFSAPSLAVADAVLRSAGPEGDKALQGVTTAIETTSGCTGLGLVHRTLLRSDDRVLPDEVTIELLD